MTKQERAKEMREALDRACEAAQAAIATVAFLRALALRANVLDPDVEKMKHELVEEDTRATAEDPDSISSWVEDTYDIKTSKQIREEYDELFMDDTDVCPPMNQ